MRAELRLDKQIARLTKWIRIKNLKRYYEWRITKPRRIAHGWTRTIGHNRSCINVTLAGDICRRRQIQKCFMKGWC